MKTRKIDMDKISQDAEQKRQIEIKDLESQSKKLYELVTMTKFTIDEVVAESYPTYFTPNSEMRIGGESPIYNGGFTSKLTLKVTPDNPEIPVEILTFDGFSIVKAGDYISAKIPKYEERTDPEIYLGNQNKKTFYIDRTFNSKESAIELALLSSEGNILRRDRSINYRNFTKE